MQSVTVSMKTDKGNIELELYPEKMPITVENFLKLVKEGFYDGLTFHRVENWVVQGGDPLGNGTGGPGWTIKLETHPDLKNVKGALAMARSSDPDSAGSQFYILKNTWPNGQYAVFGKVTKGMDVVKTISGQNEHREVVEDQANIKVPYPQQSQRDGSKLSEAVPFILLYRSQKYQEHTASFFNSLELLRSDYHFLNSLFPFYICTQELSDIPCRNHCPSVPNYRLCINIPCPAVYNSLVLFTVKTISWPPWIVTVPTPELHSTTAPKASAMARKGTIVLPFESM